MKIAQIASVILLALTASAIAQSYNPSTLTAPAAVVQAKPYPTLAVITPQMYGAKCDGATNDRTAFYNANAASESSGYQLLIQKGTGACVIGTNLTLSVTPMFAYGATLSISNSITVTFSAGIHASPAKQIFTGAGSAVFSNGPSTLVYPEWWGATNSGGSGAATTNKTAIQAAADALTSGGTVKLSSGAGGYYLACASADAVTVTNSFVNFYGDGDQNTRLRPATNCGHALLVYNVVGQSGNVRDILFIGDNLAGNYSTQAWTALYCKLGCGVMDFSHIQVYGAAIGLRADQLQAGLVSDWELQGCAYACIVLGGSALDSTGAQHVSVTHFTNVRAFNLGDSGTTGQGMIIDHGTTELSFDRFLEGGFQRGTTIQNSGVGTGAHRPEGIRFYGYTNWSANEDCGLCVNSVWRLWVSDSSANGTSAGPDVLISGNTNTDIDGIVIQNGEFIGAAQDEILIQSGCDITLLNNNILSAVNGTPNTFNGIHASADACGLLQIQDNTIGTNFWGNTTSAMKYGVQLDAGSLTDTPGPYAQTFIGRLLMTGNMLGGNQTSGYVDNSAPAGPQKEISGNLLN